MNGGRDRWTDRLNDRETDTQMELETDRWADKQNDRETDISIQNRQLFEKKLKR
jgi:hypothetical protein